MAQRPFEYTHPADNVAPRGTWVVSGAAALAGYGVDKLSNLDPQDPFKADGPALVLTWTGPAAVVIKGIVIVHANLEEALTGVSATVNGTTVPIVVPAWHEDGHPANLFADFRPTNPTDDTVVITIADANLVDVTIGEILILTEIRALSRNLIADRGVEEEEDHPIIENKTGGGASPSYEEGYVPWWFRGFVIEGGSTSEQVRSWDRARRGRARPVVVWVHQQEEEPRFVKAEKSALKRLYLGGSYTSVYSIAVEEVDRGLPPEPSPLEVEAS